MQRAYDSPCLGDFMNGAPPPPPRFPDRKRITAPGYKRGFEATPAGIPVPATDSEDAQTAMPDALRDEFRTIEQWAQANRKDALHDALRFWSLKVPAIIVSTMTGVLAYYKQSGLAVIAGAIGSFCVLMDGLNPGGALRNVHLKAFNELRMLQNNMKSRWNVGLLNEETKNRLAVTIIQIAVKEKERINGYVTAADTSLGQSHHASKSSSGPSLS